jgi:hypothetical protein
MAVYVIYWKGPTLRQRSPFAQQLEDARANRDASGKRLVKLPTEEERAIDAGKKRPANSRGSSFARAQQELRVRAATGSHLSSPAMSRRSSLDGTAHLSAAERENTTSFAPPTETKKADLMGNHRSSYSKTKINNNNISRRGHGVEGSHLTTIPSMAIDKD